MTKNKLAILLLVIIALLLVVLLKPPQETKPSLAEETIFAGINGEKVSKLVLEKGESRIVLAVSEDQWRLPEKGGYPANVGKIRAILLKLMGLNSSQRLSPTKAGLKKLALDEQGVKDGYLKITLFDKDDKQLGGIFVGKQRVGKQSSAQGGSPIGGSGGQYVRRLESDEVFLIPSPLIISTAVDEWIETNIMNVLSKNIYRIEQYSQGNLSEGNPDFTLSRIGPVSSYAESALRLDVDIPEGKEVHDSMLSQVSSGLENVRFSDVFARDEKKDITFDKVTKYYLTSGLVYSVHSSEGENDMLYAKFEVAYDQNLVDELSKLQAKEAKEEPKADSEPTSDTEGSQTSSDAENKPEKKPLLEFSSAEEAGNLQSNYSQWVYQFAGFQGSKFRKKQADLLKDKEVETTSVE